MAGCSFHRFQPRFLWIFLCLSLLLRDSFVSSSDADLISSQGNKATTLSFLVVGDWGRNGEFNQSNVASQMGKVAAELNAEFVISTGDNFYENGLKAVNDSFFKHSFTDIYTAESLQKPWYAVLGNHDYRGDALAQLSPDLKARDWRWNCQRSFSLEHSLCTENFGQLQSKECGASIEIFFIDTTPFVKKYWKVPNKHRYDWRGVEPREQYIRRQVQELDEALGSSKATWKIVVGHHPIRSVGNHGDTKQIKRLILPILESHAVDVYINGHDHCLEHIHSTSGPLQFLTSGGGSKAWRGMNSRANLNGVDMYYDGQGFLAMSVSPAFLSATFYNLQGSFHTIRLSKLPSSIQPQQVSPW